jgi:hypothetical protein
MNYIYLLTGQIFNNFVPLALAPIIITAKSIDMWGDFSLYLLAGTVGSAFYVGKIQSLHSDLVRISKNRTIGKYVLFIHTALVLDFLKKNTLLFLFLLSIAYIINEKESLNKISIIVIGLANGICQTFNVLIRLNHLILKKYSHFSIFATIFFLIKMLIVTLSINIFENIIYIIALYTSVNILEATFRCISAGLERNNKVNKILQRRSIRLRIPLLFYCLSIIIDRIIVEEMFSKQEFGQYNLVMMLIGASVFAFSPLNQKLLMFQATNIKLKKYIVLCLLIYSIVSPLVYVLVNYFIQVADILMLSNVYLYTISTLISLIQVLTGFFMVKQQIQQNISFYWKFGGISLLLNILIIPALVHLYGFSGAIIGLFMCSFIMLILSWLDSKQEMQIGYK